MFNRFTIAAAVILALAACGGGGSAVVGPVGSKMESESSSGTNSVLSKYHRHLNDGDSNDAWPEVGDYTHIFHFLVGESIGDGLFAIAPSNVSCQEESCWASEAAANSLGSVAGVQRVMEHANIPVYRIHGENTFAGFDYNTYGAWLEFSSFTVARTCDIGEDCGLRAAFDSAIPAVGGQPSGSKPRGLGSASWLGVVIAADTQTYNLILGDAEISINDLTAVTPLVDVTLTRLWDVDAGIARADIRWHGLPISDSSQTINVPVVNASPAGAFGRGHIPFPYSGVVTHDGRDDYVMGQFFGNAHQEVSGKFVHRATSTAGVFGGKRQ